MLNVFSSQLDHSALASPRKPIAKVTGACLRFDAFRGKSRACQTYVFSHERLRFRRVTNGSRPAQSSICRRPCESTHRTTEGNRRCLKGNVVSTSSGLRALAPFARFSSLLCNCVQCTPIIKKFREPTRVTSPAPARTLIVTFSRFSFIANFQLLSSPWNFGPAFTTNDRMFEYAIAFAKCCDSLYERRVHLSTTDDRLYVHPRYSRKATRTSPAIAVASLQDYDNFKNRAAGYYMRPEWRGTEPLLSSTSHTGWVR